MNLCLNCGKYLFDLSNVDKFKRLTCEEYVEGVIRRLERTNDSFEQICTTYNLHPAWMINRADCELCGAPHVVCSDEQRTKCIEWIAFYFSGTIKPTERDVSFIEEFKRKFLDGLV